MGAGAGPGLVERSPPRQPQGPCLPPRPSRGPSVYKTRNVKSTFPPLWDCWRQVLGPCLGPTGPRTCWATTGSGSFLKL